MDSRTGVIWWGAFLSLILVMMITVSHAQDEREAQPDDRQSQLLEATRKRLIDKPMPRLVVNDWINGDVDLTNAEHKFLIIQFWATWCPDCIGAIKANNDFYERFKGWGVLFAGICSSDRGQENMQDVVTEWNIEYPVAKDSTLVSMETWGVEWWPTYVLIDPDGIVRAVEGSITRIETELNRIGRFAE